MKRCMYVAAAGSSPFSKQRAAMNCSEAGLAGARASTARCSSAAASNRRTPCGPAASRSSSSTDFGSELIALTLYTGGGALGKAAELHQWQVKNYDAEALSSASSLT